MCCVMTMSCCFCWQFTHMTHKGYLATHTGTMVLRQAKASEPERDNLLVYPFQFSIKIELSEHYNFKT